MKVPNKFNDMIIFSMLLYKLFISINVPLSQLYPNINKCQTKKTVTAITRRPLQKTTSFYKSFKNNLNIRPEDFSFQPALLLKYENNYTIFKNI